MSVLNTCSVYFQVFSESLDRFGIVVCGTSGSNNPLNYDHITVADLGEDGLNGASFKLLEFVEKRVKVFYDILSSLDQQQSYVNTDCQALCACLY